MLFCEGGKPTVYKCFEIATKYPVAAASGAFTNSWCEAHMNIQRLRHAFFHRWLWFDDIRFFNLHAMLFDLEGTVKRQNVSHVHAHRRPVHGSLAFELSQVHRLVRDL